jgi:hypothetical protein
VQPGLGGFIEVSWGEGMTGRNSIEVWQPPDHLVVGNPEGGLQEDYVLAGQAGGTSLKLHHSGFAPDAEGEAYQRSIENGWRAFFAMLQHGVSRHAGQPFKNVTIFSQHSGSREAMWNSMVRPGGIAKQGLPQLNTGDHYELELSFGYKLNGTVLHALWPGYLVLTTDTLDDSVMALLCEGGEAGAMLTITWILNGSAVAREEEIKSASSQWAAK